MAYFKCKGDSKPKKLLVADWDFSSNSPLVDKVNGYVLTNNNVTFEPYNGGNVANFAKWSSYLLLPEQLVFTPNSGYDSFEYVIDFKKENGGDSTWLFGYYDEWPYTSSRIALLINRFSSGRVSWEFDNFSITDNPNDASTLNDSILTVVLSKDGGTILPKLFKNGNDITNAQQRQHDFTYTDGRVALGANSSALRMYVGGLKVYANKN